MFKNKTPDGFEIIRTSTGLSIVLDGSLSQDNSPQMINLSGQFSAQLAENNSVEFKTAIGEVQIKNFESPRDARRLLDEIALHEKKTQQSGTLLRVGMLASVALLSWSAASLTTWQLASNQMDAVITSIVDRVEMASEAQTSVAYSPRLSPAVARAAQAAERVEQLPAPTVPRPTKAATAGEWSGGGQ